MENVRAWFDLGDSRKLEEQIKYNIAVNCESFLNSIYDLGDASSWKNASLQEWEDGIYLETARAWSMFGKTYLQENHLRFYGEKGTRELIRKFLANYEDFKKATGK